MTDELVTEMNRLSAVDCKSTMEPMKASFSGVTNGLKALGILNDDQAKIVQQINGALSVITGMLSLAVAAKSFQEIKRTREEAKATALTTALVGSSVATLGLTAGEAARRIAMATAGATLVSVGIYAAMNEIHLGSFNLSTAEGQNQAIDAVQEAI